MSENTTATTAADFKAKYGKKRFTASNAGQAQLLNYIYDGIQIIDGIPRPDTETLYPDLKPIQNKVATSKNATRDANRYFAYGRLVEWTILSFQGAVNMKNAVMSAAAHLYFVASTVINGENLRQILGDKANQESVYLCLRSLLTIEGYTPQDANHYTVENIRDNITNGLHYIDCYNTLIDMIAEEIGILEYGIFKVNMEHVAALIKATNEALSALRDNVRLYRIERAEEDIGTVGNFTPEFINETLTIFQPIETDPEPLYPEAVYVVRDRIREIIDKGIHSWANLLTMLKDGYYGKQNP